MNVLGVITVPLAILGAAGIIFGHDGLYRMYNRLTKRELIEEIPERRPILRGAAEWAILVLGVIPSVGAIVSGCLWLASVFLPHRVSPLPPPIPPIPFDKCEDQSSFDHAKSQGYVPLREFFQSCPTPSATLIEQGSGAFRDFGEMFYRSNNMAAAMESERLALQLNPRNAEAHGSRGKILADLGLEERAMSETRESIKLNPMIAMTHYNLGNMLEAQNKTNEAIEEYRAAIRIDPKLSIAYNNMGIALDEKNRYGEAEDVFEEVIEMDETFVEPHIGLCTVYKHMKRYSDAMKECNRAIQLNANSVEAYNELGTVFEAVKNYGKAIEQFQKALQIDPGNTVLQDNIRLMRTHMGASR